MTFKELFSTFISGTPIKRKVWRGYWVYKYGKIEIHSKNGEVINFLDTNDILFTLSGILEDDWEYANDENCDIPVPNGKKNVLEIPKDFFKTQPFPKTNPNLYPINPYFYGPSCAKSVGMNCHG